MAFEPPWERYERHNLVLHGWPAKVFEERSWVGVNTGSFLIRSCHSRRSDHGDELVVDAGLLQAQHNSTRVVQGQ